MQNIRIESIFICVELWKCRYEPFENVYLPIENERNSSGEIKDKRIIPFHHSPSPLNLFPFSFFLIFCSTFYSGIITITPRPIVVVIVAVAVVAAIAAVIIMFFSMSIDYRRMRATFYTHLMQTLWAKHKPVVPFSLPGSLVFCSQHPQICYGINMFPTKEEI